MSNPFRFRREVSLGGEFYEAIFLFFPNCIARGAIIDRAITDENKDGRLSPDLIVFLTPISMTDQIRNCLAEPMLRERFERLKRCKGILLCPFNGNGVPDGAEWIKSINGEFQGREREIFDAARAAGLSVLSERDGVVTYAPPGAYFLNPSQGRRSYFMRAGLMCRTSVESTFVAFTLLQMVEQAKHIYSEYPNLVWVDTVSIAHIAHALATLGGELRVFTRAPEIRSFGSYAGYQHLRPSSGEFPIFIISASSSGRLAKEIVSKSENAIVPEVISTILGAYDGDYPKLLCVLSANRRGPSLNATETLREIRVSGEDFVFHPGEAKAVILKRSQLPMKFADAFERIQGKNLLHFYKRFNTERVPKAVLVDANALVEDSDFKNWILAKAKGVLPASVRRIVYQEDEASKKMASLVFDSMLPFFRDKPPTITSVTELGNLLPCENETVAVVAAVIGSGMELMRVTKALRRHQPQGSRFFLVGVIVAKTYAQLEQLKSNLLLSDEKVKYTIESWGEFAPGTEPIIRQRTREFEWLKKLQQSLAEDDDSDLENFIALRIDALGDGGIIHPESLHAQPFASFSSDLSAFDLSDGFALWKQSFANRRCPTDVLFTVACWLQHARESATIQQTDRLDDGGFQQTVIAPDCFLRFTDAVIQAAILRCARDSELDYRSSVALSQRAAEIIVKFVMYKEESLLEFLIALALGRLRILESDSDRILNECSKYLSHDSRVTHLTNEIKNVSLGKSVL
jgi:hypothetical protein